MVLCPLEVLLIKNLLHVNFSIHVIVKPLFGEILQIFVYVSLLYCMQNMDFSKQWLPVFCIHLCKGTSVP